MSEDFFFHPRIFLHLENVNLMVINAVYSALTLFSCRAYHVNPAMLG